MATRDEEIANSIERYIEKTPSMDKLPTTRELTDIYKTSSRTVAQAIDRLKARGVIFSRPGKGLYVKKRSN